MKKNLFILLLLPIFLGACESFLEEYSQDLAYAEDCNDLNEILIGEGYLKREANEQSLTYSDLNNSHYFPYLHIMDDDAVENVFGMINIASNKNEPIYQFRNMYIWAIDPFTSLIGDPFSDADWSRLYKHISTVNVVLACAEDFTDDPQELRDRVRGEAYFLRGAYYFLLVNMYADPYNSATASTDLGVPLKTSEVVEDGFFARNTVQEVYDQIVEDLSRAVDLLHGKERQSHFHADEVSACILLSRVYLYMGEWELAIKQCERAIALGCPLRNLNDMNLDARGFMKECMNNNSCETRFTMGTPTIQTLMSTTSPMFANFAVSEDLYNSYVVTEEIEDLRQKCFFVVSRFYGYRTCAKSPVQSNTVKSIDAYETYIIRSVEVYLNKAEAHAMKGEDESARLALQEIFPYRYKTGKMPQIDHLTGENLVNYIRDERRRELCFEGHRWFDLRRYAVASNYPLVTEIKHEIYDQVGDGQPGVVVGVYKLNPYGQDNAWVLPIPRYELIFNNEESDILIDNPTRTERPAL